MHTTMRLPVVVHTICAILIVTFGACSRAREVSTLPPAQIYEECESFGVVIHRYAYIHTEPTIASTVAAIARRGAIVTVIDRASHDTLYLYTGHWYKVMLNGETGWLFETDITRYCHIQQAETASRIIAPTAPIY